MDRHAANDTDSRSHHELLSQMSQLGHRERVLIGENDQLRAQLVEMKQQENKKYDDLMVQYYNIKREYKDDELNNDGTSTTNQVTDTTKSSGEEVKAEIKEEYDEEDKDIHIKREYVPEYIKTESSYEDVKMEIKREIKEEEDYHDDDFGCDRCLVKKELASDDEDVKVEIKEELKEEYVDDHDDDYGCYRGVVKREMASDDDANSMQLDDSVNVDQVMNRENALGGEDEQDLDGDDEMLNTANDNHGRSVAESTEPSTSARRGSNRFTSKQATGSTPLNVTKRKQAQLNQTVKRSKKTTQNNDDEDEEDNDDDREEVKIKVINLNCTMSNCNVKLDSLDDLHDHLRTVHQLSPYRCFASNCNLRFDDRMQISSHIQWHHSQSTEFLCSVCLKEFDSQMKTHKHWYRHHLNGQFQCNFVSDCTEVTDTRYKMILHQQTKHHSQSKHFNCTQVGCTASFAFKYELKRHELIHLNTRPFHCIWPHCNIRTNHRSSLVTHIRMQHFGLPRTVKEQKEKNIVDVRDPNEYVRVVANE